MVARQVLDDVDFSYRLSPEEWLRQCEGMTVGEIIQKELDIRSGLSNFVNK